MAEGLLYPHMDWTCSNLPDSLKKFEKHCRLMFDGPLKRKSKKEFSAYVLLWIGDKGRTIHASWDLIDDENRETQAQYSNVSETSCSQSQTQCLPGISFTTKRKETTQ